MNSYSRDWNTPYKNLIVTEKKKNEREPAE